MASSRYKVEVTLIGATDLKNVDSRHGPLRPYAVVWADPNQKRPTRVDPEGDSFPVWDQTLPIPLPPGAAVDDVMLHVHIVHASSEDGTRPLIGSAQLRLRDVLDDDNGYGGAKRWSLQLKRPSGRPHGKVDIKVAVRETRYRPPPTAYGVRPPQASREYAATPAYGSAYTAPPAYRSAYSKPYASPQQPQYERRDPYYPKAPPEVDIKVAVRETRYRPPPTAYGVPRPQASREYAAPPAYGSAYTAPPAYRSAYSKPYASPQQPQYERRDPYYPKAPPAGYPSYGGTSYDQAPSSYGQEGKKKKSKFGGMGTGLAVGGLAGVLGGLALAEVAEYVENKITNHAAEKAEDDLAYQDDGDGDYYQDDGDDYQEDGGDGNDYQYDGNNDGQDYQDSGGGGDGNYYQYGGDYGQDYGDGNDYQNHGGNGDDGQVYGDGDDYQDDSGDGNDYQNHGGNGDDAQIYGDGDDYQDNGGYGNDYQNHGGNGDDAQVYGDGDDYQDNGGYGHDYQNHGGNGDDGQVYGEGEDYQDGGHSNDYQNHGGNGDDGQVYSIGDDYQDNDGEGNVYQYDGDDGQDYGDGDGDGVDSQDDREDYY